MYRYACAAMNLGSPCTVVPRLRGKGCASTYPPEPEATHHSTGHTTGLLGRHRAASVCLGIDSSQFLLRQRQPATGAVWSATTTADSCELAVAQTHRPGQRKAQATTSTTTPLKGSCSEHDALSTPSAVHLAVRLAAGRGWGGGASAGTHNASDVHRKQKHKHSTSRAEQGNTNRNHKK